MLVKIFWPKDSKRKVKLKRNLFGYKSIRGDSKIKIKGKFHVRRIKRGIIQVPSVEWLNLKKFLDELGVSYEIIYSKNLISGPLALIKHGVNAFDKSYFRFPLDEEGVIRAYGKYAGLEDAIVSTFWRAINNREEWLNYVVMGFLLRELDWSYIIRRAWELNISDEFNEFLSLVFRTLRGELDTNIIRELYDLTIKYKDIVSYFRSLHWEIPPLNALIYEFNGLNPKIIVSLAVKQLFYG